MLTSSDVPLIISTTLDDAAFLWPQVGLTEAELQLILEQRYGEHGSALHRLYRGYRPEKTPYLLLGEIVADAGFRRFAHIQAARRATLGPAPVYVYQWRWPSPAFEGVYGAAHAIDVPATFHNLHDWPFD